MTEPHSLVGRVADARVRRPDDRRAAGPAGPARAHHRDRRRERLRQVHAAARARPAHRAALGPGRARRQGAARPPHQRDRAHARPAAAEPRSHPRASPSPTSSAAAGIRTRSCSPAGPRTTTRSSRSRSPRPGIAELADRSVDELSGGQRQRVWIAMALAQETDILLLDEPTTFLDVAHQVEVLDLLTDLNRDRGTTIVMVLHDMNLAARYADHLFAMRDGRIVASGPPSRGHDERADPRGVRPRRARRPRPGLGHPDRPPSRPAPRLAAPHTSSDARPIRQEPRCHPTASAIRFFRAPVTAITDLTPSFRRFTFGGDDLADYGDPGLRPAGQGRLPDRDHRPRRDARRATTGTRSGARCPRTSARRSGRTRRARFATTCTRSTSTWSRTTCWARHPRGSRGAAVGDEVLILAPTTAHTGRQLRHRLRAARRAPSKLLLAGDETAAPAIAVILEQLPPEARGVVVLELPHRRRRRLPARTIPASSTG